MATPVPSIGALRALRQSLRSDVRQTTQVRHATLLRRPKRPYTFTQLVTLSDGSAFTLRTTSPQPVYKSTKDIRNTPLWNPSSRKLLNVEEDEAGKLAAFRAKFGRGWDADAEKGEDSADHLLDLISAKKAPAKEANSAKQPAAPPTAAPAKGAKGAKK